MTPTISHRSLADRLSEGKLPVAEALQYAMKLADALRRIHDGGHVYGSLSTSNIAFTGATVELVANPPAQGLTPYTAPEVVNGHPADSRSDIFAFGAILFEMLTGRRAFEGDSHESLAAALTTAPAPSSGSPLVDRLVASCVAKDPTVRCQRMQKIIMELKLLSVAARRAEATTPSRAAQTEAQLRAELQQMEARFAARIEAHDHALAQMQQAHQHTIAEMQEQHRNAISQVHEAAGQVVEALRGQIGEVHNRINETHTRINETHHRLDEAHQRINQPVEEARALQNQVMERVEQALAPLGQRLHDTESSLLELRNRTAAIQEALAGDFDGIENTLRGHAAAIESARTAMAQTDDLVERVVEALELLQSSVLDQQEERATLN